MLGVDQQGLNRADGRFVPGTQRPGEVEHALTREQPLRSRVERQVADQAEMNGLDGFGEHLVAEREKHDAHHPLESLDGGTLRSHSSRPASRLSSSSASSPAVSRASATASG